MKSTERKGILQMALCSVLWSISGVFIKLIPWNGLVLSGIRSLICALVFAVYLIATRRPFILNPKTLRLAVLNGLMCTLFVLANKLTTAANAIVLQYTAPVFLLLFETVFRKKRFRAGDYLAVALTMTGIALFFFDKLDSGALLGNLLAIVAGALFAATMLAVETLDENARLSGLAQGHFLAALVSVPFLLHYGAPMVGYALPAILILGIFQLGIPYILYGLAASHCAPLTLTLLAALEPILNPVWVFLFVGEAPGSTALFGGVLVIVSVTLWCIWDAKQKARSVAAANLPFAT
ncbi:MAG TPA: DMT family transporter [Candidatus Limiplasma sp.]|nr:DMT family transporter [Candidatus Limiplasma sp.]HPS80579.1 DMT family transporter [Candidatus Limiplasma sp.]